MQIKSYIEKFYSSVKENGIEEYRDFLNCIAKGNLYKYNFNNQILIYMQQPEAEVVADYEAWKQKNYIPRRHSAIYASMEDKMCISPYLFSNKNILRISEEEVEKLSWNMTDEDIESINKSFVDYKEQFPDTISEAAEKCFQEIELDFLESHSFAREVARCASENLILHRCWFDYSWPEDITVMFNQIPADAREEMIKNIQPYVSQFAETILGNIGRLLAIKKERENSTPLQNLQEEHIKIPQKHKIEDFGEKIGGARKDLWAARGLLLEDLLEMNDGEKKKYVNKNQVWPKPDYKQMKKEGLPAAIIYFYKKMRDALPVEPSTMNPETYVSFASFIKEETLKCRNEQDIKRLKNLVEDKYLIKISPYKMSIKSGYAGLINTKLLNCLMDDLSSLEREVRKKKFLYTDEEKILADYQIEKYDENYEWSDYPKKATLIKNYGFGRYYYYPEGECAYKEKWNAGTFFVSRHSRIVGINFLTKEEAQQHILKDSHTIEKVKKSRKKKWKSPILEHLERTGLADVCEGRMIEGKNFCDEFAIRGGEFGNWLSERDKQTNLNMAYEAFCDIALALDIDKKDVSIGGNLAIAFGARGEGNAAAHYEPMLKVINLTKMKGAGSLGHEWAHALDFISQDILGRKTEQREAVSEAMKWREEKGKRVETEFYKNSKKFDSLYSKCGKGYWSSDEEMFARAFACYLTDKISEYGGKSDYLNGHSETNKIQDNGNIIHAYPVGEERKIINREIEHMITALKEEKVLHYPQQERIIYRRR